MKLISLSFKIILKHHNYDIDNMNNFYNSTISKDGNLYLHNLKIVKRNGKRYCMFRV